MRQQATERPILVNQKRDTYRHGNLKAEAIASAYRLLETNDNASLSLRAVAKEVGVAHRSLYNHFGDREALLNEVATQGYIRLKDELAKTTTPQDHIAAYVRFARQSGGIYSLMMSRPHGKMKDNPELQNAVHGVISEVMTMFCNDITQAQDRRRQVMKVYMLLYGGISLFSAGILDQPDEASLVEELHLMIAAEFR